MILLRVKATNEAIGEIDESQLQFLMDQLEEEDTQDRDYAITPLLLQSFAAEGADPHLMAMLEGVLGDRDTIEIVWSRES